MPAARRGTGPRPVGVQAVERRLDEGPDATEGDDVNRGMHIDGRTILEARG